MQPAPPVFLALLGLQVLLVQPAPPDRLAPLVRLEQLARLALLVCLAQPAPLAQPVLMA